MGFICNDRTVRLHLSSLHLLLDRVQTQCGPTRRSSRDLLRSTFHKNDPPHWAEIQPRDLFSPLHYRNKLKAQLQKKRDKDTVHSKKSVQLSESVSQNSPTWGNQC